MLNKLRKYFISGFVVFLPLSLTVYFFILTINIADGFLGRYLKPYFYEYFGFYFRGVGILVTVCLIVVTGFFVTNFLGRKIYAYLEGLLLKLPFFKQVYPALKEMVVFLFSQDQVKSFKQVVLVEYPRKGVYSYGFLTNETSSKIGGKVKRELCNVFVPSSPSPFTGYVLLVPKDEIIFTDVTIEDAVKVIASGGVVNPGY